MELVPPTSSSSSFTAELRSFAALLKLKLSVIAEPRFAQRRAELLGDAVP
jgi:hypothetical protein